MFSDVIDEAIGLDRAGLDTLLRDTELEHRRLEAKLAGLLAVADQRQLPAVDGHRSMTAYLRATFNWSTGEAARTMKMSRAVDRVDGLGDAWWTGRIGAPQVRELAGVYANRRVRDAFEQVAPVLIGHAETLPYSDFRVVVEHFVSKADADGAHEDRDENIEHRNARVVDVGGSLDVRASGGDALTADEMISIFNRFCDLEYQKDLEARRSEHGLDADGQPLARSAKQRRFDAMINMFRDAAASAGLGGVADPLVNVIVDADTMAVVLHEAGLAPDTTMDGLPVDPFTGVERPSQLLADLVEDPDRLVSRRCETANGVQLHLHDVLRAALAGHVRRVVVDSAGVTVDMGRKQRLFTGPARDAAKMLIRHCQHPGCELPVDFCQVDHSHEWAADGQTDQVNTGILCNGHNPQKSERRWQTRRATTGHMYTIRPDGTIMLPVGIRPPVFPDENDDDGLHDDRPGGLDIPNGGADDHSTFDADDAKIYRLAELARRLRELLMDDAA